jgi:hypothetical protein
MLLKVHEAYRKVAAVCDAELLGKKYTEGNRQLDINSDFYGGKKMDEAKLINALKELNEDDATFNIVGKKSVNAAIKAGIIAKEGIIKVKGIPFALGLL